MRAKCRLSRAKVNTDKEKTMASILIVSGTILVLALVPVVWSLVYGDK